MSKSDLEGILRKIAAAALQLIDDQVLHFGKPEDFDGMGKAPLPEGMIRTVLNQCGMEEISFRNFDISLLSTDENLSEGARPRMKANALVVVLGPEYWYPDAINASRWDGTSWKPLRSGDTAFIAVETEYGFSVTSGGYLVLLMISTPRLDEVDKNGLTLSEHMRVIQK